jgi:glyoxylase-like metal-dependent hydrolase (beta-lactamase superfamily II)
VVLIEHAHVDHYGAVPAIREALDVTVAIPEADADALRSAGIEPDVTLTDGQTRWGIEPIATPGHTPGNMAYRYGDCLLAGDTVVGSDSVFAASDDWSGPLAVVEARFNDDDTQARESVSRLRALDLDSVLVSHGSHVRDGADSAIETLCRDLA